MVCFSKRAKEFGLTYADASGTTKDLMFDYLINLEIREVKPDKVLLAEEIGVKSGKRHYHAYVHYPKKVSANTFTFDAFGLHCHIDDVKRDSSKRTIIPMLKYLTKEDQAPLATWDYRSELDAGSSGASTGSCEPDWERYLVEGLTQSEVEDRLIQDGFAARYANRFLNWNSFIKKKFPNDRKEEYATNPTFRFCLPEELAMWKFRFNGWIDSFNSLGEWSRPNSLILIGPSRSGKTEWARSLGKHMYFNNLLNLDDWDESADYIILDDFSSDILKYLPSWKCFFGGQKQFTLTDKYRGKKTVHWGKPMIWLSNEDIFKNLNIEHINFIKKNCTVIVLDKNLY